MLPAVHQRSAGEGVSPLPGGAPPVEVLLRALVVAVALGGLAAGLLMEPAGSGPGGLSLAGFTLPGVCALNELTGVPCPGCGLTRAWVSALHGGLGESLAHHPLGWLVLLYVLAQGARHAAWLLLPARRGGIDRVGRPLDRGLVVIGVLLVVVWVPRIVGLLHDRV